LADIWIRRGLIRGSGRVTVNDLVLSRKKEVCYMDVGMASNNAGAVQSTYSANAVTKTEEVKKSNVSGKTVGQPKLSDKAKKYYDELKNKYGKMDFVLVSSDMKDMAKANAASFANPNKMVVLIDEDKIERMAEDEEFRKKYEGVIASAQQNMPKLKEAFGNSENVKGYGMQVHDNGTASFFAVMKKSSDQQTARIQEKREAKRAEKKAADKKAAKKAQEERIREKRAEKAQEIISASSVEELVRKVEDYQFTQRSDSVMTDSEMMVGQHIDFRG